MVTMESGVSSVREDDAGDLKVGRRAVVGLIEVRRHKSIGVWH